MTRRPFEGLRILEYGDLISAPYCGKLLAGLGAETIKIERPGEGDRARRHGPFPKDIADPEQSGLFLFLNTGKLGITLDPETVTGKEAFRRLVKAADVLIENNAPGHMSRLGLDYQSLSRLNPRLIMASITPFGQSGPYRDYKAHHINSCAAGGVAVGIGRPGQEPLTMPLSQGGYQAGASAATAILMALLARDKIGKGQHIDISETEVWATIHSGGRVLVFLYRGVTGTRRGVHGGYFRYPCTIFPCKDGHVSANAPQLDQWLRFLELIGNPEWTKNPRYRDRRAMEEEYPDEVDALITPWFMERTKDDILKLCQEKRVPIAPVYDIAEVVNHPQLRQLGFWADIKHQRAGMLKYPKGPCRFHRTDWEWERAAPLLGEHNEKVLCGQLGYSGEQLAAAGKGQSSAGSGSLSFSTFAPTTSSREHGVMRPLSGYRLLDFGTAWAGPQVGQLLADAGMEVIKVETRAKLDGMRMGRPIVGDDVAGGDEGKWPDMQPNFHGLNRNKLSFTINLKQPRSKEVIYDLVRISDVVLDNSSPGVMARLGLGHDSLTKVKPDIISLSMTACGESGPLRDTLVYAPLIIALGGLQSLVGYRGEKTPMQVASAYGDANASVHGTFAVLAALWHREQTGQGQHIELAECYTVTSLLGEAIMEYAMNGRIMGPQGSFHPTLCPHGIYPCQGEDRWAAIAVDTEEQWKGFCQAIGAPEWVSNGRFLTRADRLKHSKDLDGLIAERTIRYTPAQLTEALQLAGVAATPVMNIEDQYTDAQYRYRKTYVELTHPLVGAEILYGNPLRLSETPPGMERPAPSLGEHNDYVLGKLLGYSAANIEALAREEVIF